MQNAGGSGLPFSSTWLVTVGIAGVSATTTSRLLSSCRRWEDSMRACVAPRQAPSKGPTPPSLLVCSFQYVFGSDEYEEYVGAAYNDGFRLIVDGDN